ncbi:MAG: mannose-1-phosphate guanylyltransferase [Bacteroidales bacterium]|nr:mannose-1-phosphate guanylyltransferase [Bacteroidales bacterium]
MTEHIVLLAGGVGSRLFPISTPERPKQFLDLLGCGKSLIRMTYERFLQASPHAHFWVVTGGNYAPLVHEQIPEIPEDNILAEPVGRNTAPCIAYACRKILRLYPDANVVVAPSDAYVPDSAAFAASIREALAFTGGREAVVCLGIAPRSPHTGYGYIKAEAAPGKVVKVEAFKEKPELSVAERYFSEGGYWWNAGIFVWNVGTIEAELRRYAPQISEIMDALEPSLGTPLEQKALEELFPQCPKISIDYAVMEQSSVVYMLAADWEWSDLGSFEAIEQITGRNPLKNI